MGLITCRKKVYGSDSTSVGAVSVEGLCTTQGVTPRDGRLTHAEDVAHKLQVKAKSLSPVQLSATLRTAAHQAPPSMGFSRQEYWSGVPLPSLALAGGFFPSTHLPMQVRCKSCRFDP